jgi:hypothetical protein
VIGPISVKPINQQDTVILPETLTALVDFTDQIGIDLAGSAITLDAGFDSQNNKDLIKAHHMQPVIYPNRRNAKTPIAIARMFRWFDLGCPNRLLVVGRFLDSRCQSHLSSTW